MWFDQVPRDLDWRGDYTYRNETDLDLAPDEVFAIFADIDQWPLWFEDITRGTWISEPPHGIGAEREVHLKNVSVRERFVAWDPGRRYAFTMTATTLPITGSIVEDYRLEPRGAGSRFVYEVRHDLRWWARPASPVVRSVFGRMFREATASLRAYVAHQAKRAS